MNYDAGMAAFNEDNRRWHNDRMLLHECPICGMGQHGWEMPDHMAMHRRLGVSTRADYAALLELLREEFEAGRDMADALDALDDRGSGR